MGVTIYIPKMGANIESATIGKIFVKLGDEVRKGDPLLEIITDKAVFLVEAESSGKILAMNCKEQEEVLVLDEIGYIGEIGEKVPELKKMSKNTPIASSPKEIILREEHSNTQVQATPLAKKLASENNLDLQKCFKGETKIIREQDILALINNKPIQSSELLVDAVKKAEIANLKKSSEAISSTIVVLVEENKIQEKIKQALKNEGINISAGEYISYYAAKTLRKFPRLNASFESDKILIKRDINVGFAVSVDERLLVPVIKNADVLSIKEFSEESKRLTIDAFSNKIRAEQMQDSTFTISDLSSFGVTMFNPVLNANQSAIFGICSTQDSWKMDNSSLVYSPKRALIITFDHRVANGVYVANFLNSLKLLLEN